MAKVTLKNIKKVYEKNVVAVRDFDLDIEDKEFIVFVGPSGCGKTTTLRMIAGLEKITCGELYIGEKLVNDIEPKDRDIAMVFQNYALYPHMSVYKNMSFALRIQKMKKNEIDKRVKEAAKILNIEELLDRKPKQLSGGQRQRVAIGRAIVRQPKVFLMDEPLSNLDAKLRNLMRTELIKLHKALDTTFIYVTHDQIEAITLGTRIVVMRDGIMQQVDTPKNILNKPVNIFVAQFIGVPQMNLFRGGRINECDGYSVELFGKTYDLPESIQKELKKKRVRAQEIIVGIRPEDIDLNGDHRDAIDANIEVSELMGSEIYLHAKVVEQEITMKVNASFDEEIKQVKIRLIPEKMHLFSIETERSLLYG